MAIWHIGFVCHHSFADKKAAVAAIDNALNHKLSRLESWSPGVFSWGSDDLIRVDATEKADVGLMEIYLQYNFRTSGTGHASDFQDVVRCLRNVGITAVFEKKIIADMSEGEIQSLIKELSEKKIRDFEMKTKHR